MHPEHRSLHEVLNPFNQIAVEEMYVIMVGKVGWICQLFVTHDDNFPESRCTMYDIWFNNVNQQWDDVPLLMVTIVQFLKHWLIASLLNMCFIQECADPYTSFEEFSGH
jgi:hypothetical protein